MRHGYPAALGKTSEKKFNLKQKKEQNLWLAINKFPLKLPVIIGSVIQLLMFQPGLGGKRESSQSVLIRGNGNSKSIEKL